MKDLIVFECEKCTQKNKVEVDWRTAPVVEDHERPMGKERFHQCILEHPLKCVCCGCEINVVNVYEYPDGAFNYAVGRCDKMI